jgi:hypothetical protein
MALTITLAQLESVVRSLVEDIDYDIAKQYDPDCHGREDPGGARRSTTLGPPARPRRGRAPLTPERMPTTKHQESREGAEPAMV